LALLVLKGPHIRKEGLVVADNTSLMCIYHLYYEKIRWNSGTTTA
jgi:hypothetical protein